MRVADESLQNTTFALNQSETAWAAIDALTGNLDQTAVDGLVDVVYEHDSAKICVAAIRALQTVELAVVDEALLEATYSPLASVRLAAIETIAARNNIDCVDRFEELLVNDISWLVRRRTMQLLKAESCPWRILQAADDPHWRVRYALLELLLELGTDELKRPTILGKLNEMPDPSQRIVGVLLTLEHRWKVESTHSEPIAPAVENDCPFWDWDPAVLTRTLSEMEDRGRAKNIDSMPALLRHTDQRVRAFASKALLLSGDARHIQQALVLLDEPRADSFTSVCGLLQQLDLDRREETARLIFVEYESSTCSQLAWAIDQIDDVTIPFDEFPLELTSVCETFESQTPPVQVAIARLIERHPDIVSIDLLNRFVDQTKLVQSAILETVVRGNKNVSEEFVIAQLNADNVEIRIAAIALVLANFNQSLLLEIVNDKDARVRRALATGLLSHSPSSSLLNQLQTDRNCSVRAMALTASRAKEIIADPTIETSWSVIRQAARLVGVAIWEIQPANVWTPARQPTRKVEPLNVVVKQAEHVRHCGPSRWPICPLGLSGHYGLPVEGYVKAMEHGVNFMFWEPNYGTMTQFVQRLNPTDRERVYLVAGTFEADSKQIEKNVDRALRLLQLESLPLFLVFWTRSWERISPVVYQTLLDLQSSGKIQQFGLSTHSRSLALEAIAANWNPVMVRHSAAHNKAEQEIFPAAKQYGTSLITFSNTCYGRLFKAAPVAGLPPSSNIDPADCYRYTLSFDAVTACFTAPATLEQLDQNLAALRDPTLSESSRARLLERGRQLYLEETAFRERVRSL